MRRAITTWGEFGGGGKTTVAVNTAAALGRAGADVLAVDLDPQAGGLTDHFGRADLRDRDRHLGDALLAPEETDVRGLVADAGARGVDVLPSHPALANAAAELAADSTIRLEQFRLQRALQPVYDDYDYLVVDPQASLNLLVDNALVATRSVVIPVELSRKGAVSVEGFRETVAAMEEEFGHLDLEGEFSIDVLAVVPNAVTDTNIAAAARRALRERGEPVVDFEVRRRTLLQYAWAAGQSVFDYAEANPDAVRDYERDVLEDFRRLAAVVRRGHLGEYAAGPPATDGPTDGGGGAGTGADAGAGGAGGGTGTGTGTHADADSDTGPRSPGALLGGGR